MAIKRMRIPAEEMHDFLYEDCPEAISKFCAKYRKEGNFVKAIWKNGSCSKRIPKESIFTFDPKRSDYVEILSFNAGIITITNDSIFTVVQPVVKISDLNDREYKFIGYDEDDEPVMVDVKRPRALVPLKANGCRKVPAKPSV